jgi:hypothetical protein
MFRRVGPGKAETMPGKYGAGSGTLRAPDFGAISIRHPILSSIVDSVSIGPEWIYLISGSKEEWREQRPQV